MSVENDHKTLNAFRQVKLMHEHFGSKHTSTIERKLFMKLLDRGIIKRVNDIYYWEGMKVRRG